MKIFKLLVMIVATSFLASCTLMVHIGNKRHEKQRNTKYCSAFTALKHHQFEHCYLAKNSPTYGTGVDSRLSDFAIVKNSKTRKYAIINPQGELQTPYYDKISRYGVEMFAVTNGKEKFSLNWDYSILPANILSPNP